MRKINLRVLLLATVAAGVVASVAVAAQSEPPSAAFLQQQIAVGSDSAGRAWYLGGFSALAALGASGKEYWTLTDRGPNDDSDRVVPSTTDGLYCAAKPSGKVIFLPDFTPQLVKLSVQGGATSIQDRILLHDGSHLATGLPNLAGDESSWVQTDAAAKTCGAAPRNAFGVDTEGVVVDPRDETFWLADEYRPSILHVAPDGQILARIVPADLSSPSLPTATQYAAAVTAAGGTLAVQPALPGIVNGFRKNRGFEGIAASPDGTTLYAALQSPMDYQAAFPGVSNSNRNLARNSPFIRVFRIDVSDPAAPVVNAEWLYLLSRGFSNAVPDKISDLEWIAPDVLLIEERDDERPTLITNFYRADFTGATNLLDPANAAAFALGAKTTVPMLEMTTSVPASITPATTAPAIDLDAMLSAAGFVNSKIEGTASLRARGANPALFAAVNDNDFDLDHTVLPSTFPASNPEQVDIFPQP
jgi:Esterase-like activity of phytase